MKIIAVAMQKGGVGKTTSAGHIAAGLADLGKRVLLVDLDPQCQAAQFFGVAVDPDRTVYEFIVEERPMGECLYPVRNLQLIPADRNWKTADVELYPMIDGRTKLKKALVQAEGRFDLVVLDTPPNLGALTVNALVAAHEVVVPVQTRQADVNELPTFLQTFEEVRVNLNEELRIAGLLPTRYDCRKAQDQQVLAMLRKNPVGARCFDPIPERARIQECFTVGKPVYDFNRDAGIEYERAVEALADGC